jgi:hypothetical protein
VKVILALLTPAIIAAALSMSASNVVGETPPEPNLPKTTVVWAERFFFAQPDLAAWLHARGVSYNAWAEKHPKAAARQQRRARAKAAAAH